MTEGNHEAWPPTREDFERDLAPEIEGEDRESLTSLAMRLSQERPVPRPGWRSAIRARLFAEHSPAARLRIGRLILGYSASGALLLLIAALGLVGIGPFAA